MAHRPLDLPFLPPRGAWRGVRLRLAWPEASVWLRAQLLAERERWLLWLPVGMGVGIALYFGLAREPPVWLGAAGLALVVECPSLPEPVYVDRDMWEKILLNLLSNAFKFTFEGQIRVALDWHGDRVELRVSDTGIGIALPSCRACSSAFIV